MAWTTPRTWVVAEKVTAAMMNAHVRDNLNALLTSPGGISGGFIKYARTTANFTKNASTTFSDVSGLSFAIAENEIWAFLLSLPYISAAAAGIKYKLTFPAGLTGRYGLMYFIGTGHRSAAIGTDLTGGSGGGVDEQHIMTGVAVNAGTAGTVQLQAAQNASDATNTIIYANSFLIAVRIA